MLNDTAEHTESLETDICIIGSGAAGLVLASEFFNTDTHVCILESGKAEASKPDPMYSFDSPTLPISPNSRVRVFGGTTTKWAGRWRELDAIDFSVREWVTHSGWPLSLEDLSPYYNRAADLFSVPILHSEKPVAMPSLKGSSLEYATFRFVQKSRCNLADYFKNQLRNSRNVTTHLDAHVARLQQESGVVRSALVKNSSGKEFKVHAKTFVLAAGGIENPRLLLLSDIGNEYDQVGRYYMDHPKGACGVVETYHPLDLSESAFLTNTSASTFGVRMSDSYQKSRGILDSHIYLEPLTDLTIPVRMWHKVFPSKRHVSPVALMRNYLEQAPNPSNRVSLSTELDPLGLPRAHVEWSIGEIDKKTMYRFHELLQSELPRLGIGELRSPLLENPDVFPLTQDASHHMGTTRMGNDPRTSVVDANGKVHGMKNLYAAGSSVFTTGGAAGPVATIVALAIRLADHFKGYD
jgi:choline dehydrogenase-like flavoprotein